MVPDQLTFERAGARIGRIMVVVAVLGILTAYQRGGWKAAAGFALGAAISWINYRALYKLVESLGATTKPRMRAVLLGFRYLILGGGAYVILKLSPISLTAVLLGLFVMTAAVFVEVIIELIVSGRNYGK